MAMCGAEPRGIVCRRCLCGFPIITRSFVGVMGLANARLTVPQHYP